MRLSMQARSVRSAELEYPTIAVIRRGNLEAKQVPSTVGVEDSPRYRQGATTGLLSHGSGGAVSQALSLYSLRCARTPRIWHLHG